MTLAIDFDAMLSAAKAKQVEVEVIEVVKTADMAKAFILALRSTRSKAEEGEAIKTFTGKYSRGEPHGVQLDVARNQARKLLATGVKDVSKEYSRCSPSLGGYVAGMPNALEKQRGIVQAQMREAMEAVRNGVAGAEEQVETLRGVLSAM